MYIFVSKTMVWMRSACSCGLHIAKLTYKSKKKEECPNNTSLSIIIFIKVKSSRQNIYSTYNKQATAIKMIICLRAHLNIQLNLEHAGGGEIATFRGKRQQWQSSTFAKIHSEV